MTKSQFKKKIKSMRKDINKYIEKECMRLYDSGAIDTSSYLQDCTLAKIILVVALRNCSDQYLPPAHNNLLLRDIINLRHF